MKKVLVLAHAYYPLFHGGVPRIAKFCKYLPDFGWSPTLVTVDWRDHLGGRSTTDMQDSCEVIRVATKSLKYESPKLHVSNRLQLHLKRYQKTIEDVMYQDIEKDMYIASRSTCIKSRFDVILASSFPQYIHRIAKKISTEFGIPWVADHRDIYGQEPVIENGIRRLSRQYDVNRGIKNDIDNCQNASSIITVSEGLSEMLEKRTSKHVEVVTNGYDDDDYLHISTPKRNQKMTIVYTGSLFGNRSCDVFIDAINKLLKKHPEYREKLCVEFYGSCCESFYEKVPKANEISDIILLKGYVKHHEAIQAICMADILYLISHQAKGIATGKLYEYLRAGKPILSIPGDGDITDRIIQESNAGKITNNLEQAEEILLKWLEEWDNNGLLKYDADTVYIRQFNRRNLTGKLATILDGVVK